jgi:DNA polymerase
VTVLSIDFETRATVDLRTAGLYVYAQHPDTDIWCFAWAFDDEEPEIWHPGMGWPPSADTKRGERFLMHIIKGGEMRAWNAAFERIIWREILTPRYGFPEPKMKQWVCSAAEAAAMSLPRSLDQVAQVTGVGQQKDVEGYQLMMRMTRPRKIMDDGTIVWWDVEERKQRLYEYCKQDVRTERAITKVLRRLTLREREIYLHTELKNDRGIYLDRPLVLAAKDIVQEGVDRANAALAEVTGGALDSVTATGRMRDWIQTQSDKIAVQSVSKAAVREMLESDLDPKIRKVLELRAEAGRSSTAKLDRMLDMACTDDFIRGLTMYHGASTGREAGKGVQPHNFTRPELPKPNPKMTDEEYAAYIESFISLVMDGAYDAIDLMHSPISVIVSLLRSMIRAKPGYELTAGDFAGIEARVLNILAGQDDIVALFASGEDVYSYNAGRMPGTPEPYVKGKKHPWRQTGKFQELGCGFGMGWKTAITQGKAQYGLDLDEESARFIIDNYRSTHPRNVDFWYESDRCAMEAVAKPGSVVTFGALRNLKFTQQGAYLYLILPSRRPLVYAAPRIEESMTPWGEMKDGVTIFAVDPYTHKWGPQRMYGGLWVENIVQAVSRDLMMEANLRVEQHGYEVILNVHDEVVAQAPVGHGSVEEFEKLLEETPEWAKGWPIKAEGWRGERYRK